MDPWRISAPGGAELALAITDYDCWLPAVGG
jgi:hypothetical protein